MVYLVTGAGGQLGRAVLAAAAARGEAAVGVGHAELEVEDGAAVERCITAHRPRLVLHCGAWTDVDGCERDPDRAERVNGAGTEHVAAACRAAGAGLVYVSTDFVFDGAARQPYRVNDPTAPLSAYGSSKLSGEHAVLAVATPGHYVVRTSWVFGPGGKNFPSAILARARSGQPLAVVDDQIGCPTLTFDLADALLDLAVSGATAGVYHAANAGSCSWHGLAVEILARAGFGDVPVATMRSAELDRPAPRPAYSVLDCSRLTSVRGCPLPTYQDAVARYLTKQPK